MYIPVPVPNRRCSSTRAPAQATPQHCDLCCILATIALVQNYFAPILLT